MRPQISARGVRLFDDDEVERVAEDVALSGKALDTAPSINVHADARPTWTEHEELQAEHSTMEVRAFNAEAELGEARAQLDEERTEVERLREMVDTFEAHSREEGSRRKKWTRQIDEACALLLGEVEEPDEGTELIVDAILELLEDAPGPNIPAIER